MVTKMESYHSTSSGRASSVVYSN